MHMDARLDTPDSIASTVAMLRIYVVRVVLTVKPPRVC